jgi:hypothetical protein
MRRSLTILLCLFGLVVIGGAAAANAAAAPAPAAEQYAAPAASAADLHNRQADLQSTALLVEIGPYASWRWQSGTGAPLVCVDNQSSTPFQQAAEQWNNNPDFTVLYENGNDCAGYSNAYRIDIMNGTRTDVCSYIYRLVGTDNVVDRLILYTGANPACDSNQIRENNLASSALGSALGMMFFATGGSSDPGYISVMRIESYDTVSWPQAGDHNTLAYYNGSPWYLVLLLPVALWLHRRANRRREAQQLAA